MLVIQVLVVFMLTILDNIDALDVTMQSMECTPNKEICFDNICNLRTNSKGKQLFDFACNFKDPQENMVATIIMFRKEGNGYKQFLINKTEEICSSSNNALSSHLTSVVNCGNFMDACPAKGNRTLIGCPMDMSAIPGIIPNGEYKTESFLRNTVTNKDIISTVSYFTIGPKA